MTIEQQEAILAAQKKLAEMQRRAEWKKMRPVVRSVAAFLLSFRTGDLARGNYKIADEYLAEFEKDADLK